MYILYVKKNINHIRCLLVFVWSTWKNVLRGRDTTADVLNNTSSHQTSNLLRARSQFEWNQAGKSKRIA